jgi:lysozyme
MMRPNNYKISKRGLDLIKKFEGIRLRGYLDPIGLLTIGYGHLVKAGETFKLNSVISEYDAQALLLNDVRWAENAVNGNVNVKLEQHQFDALVSLVFNIGQTNFLRSSCLKYLNRGWYSSAGRRILPFVFAGGRKLPGLIRRRRAEYNLFRGV